MSMNGSDGTALDGLLRRSRSRFRLRRALRGLALASAVVCAALLLALVLLDLSRFDDGVVSAVRTGLVVLLLGAAVLFILAPSLTRLPDRDLARYLEASDPELDALVITAVEMRDGASGDSSPGLAAAVIDRAARRLRASPAVAREGPGTRRALLGVAVVVALTAGLLYTGPAPWRHGMAVLFAPQSETAAQSPYSIEVVPGDAVHLAGDDLRILARVGGFEPEALAILSQDAGSRRWLGTPLQPASEEGGHELMLFDLQHSFRYQVRDGDLASPIYQVTVIPRPVVERIDLVYHHPERSARPPTRVRDGGDIDAVRGTRVELRIAASGVDLTGGGTGGPGRLLMDGEREVALQARDGMLVAEIPIERDGSYRVDLAARAHGLVPASPEHLILAREDRVPSLALLSPGGDVKVTRIEEVLIAARAEDDVAVRSLELVLSVNGEEEKVIPLPPMNDASEQVWSDPLLPSHSLEGELELFLEERDLAPGDMLAYYLRATDDPQDPSREVRSDIFFLDVRPFDRAFRRARGGGGGGGGGGGQGGDQNLSAQQRALVVALFKLVRDGEAMPEGQLGERIGLLEEAQGRIRTRTEAISSRIGARSLMDENPGYRQMAEELPKAAEAMKETQDLLAGDDVEAALPVARTALLHLQRADAALREVRVAQSRQRGGGGQASSDLSNLFKLEMDRFRNQYEDVQRGNWNPQRQRERDDTLRRLQELAERQQRELERARGDAGSSAAQRQLARDVEALLRELQRLTRRRGESEESLRQSMKELEQAARAMREAGGSGDARAGQEALDRLRAARERLDGGAGRLSEGVERAQQRARALRQEQEQIARALSEAEARQGRAGGSSSSQGGSSSSPQGGGTPSPQGSEGGSGTSGGGADAARGNAQAGDEAGTVPERKRALGEATEELQQRLEGLVAEARREREAEAARRLGESARTLRNARLGERLRTQADRIERDPGAADASQEAAVTETLTTLEQRLARAAGALTGDATREAARRLDRLREELRGVDRDARRIADAARSGAQDRGRAGATGTPGGQRSAGGSVDGGRPGGALGGGGGDGRGATLPLDLDRIRAAASARNAQLLTLLDPIREQQDLRGEMDALLSAMEALGDDPGGDADLLARRYADLRTTLQALELALRGDEPTARAGTDSAPRGEALPWRRLEADDYFRNLSEREVGR